MKRFAFVPILGCLLLFLGLTSSRVHDFDLFWQLQSGRYIWQSGTFIYHDLFSLAAEAPRWEHCWLHDLIVYGLYNLGGYAAISLWKGLLLTTTAGVLAVVARRRGAPWAIILTCAPILWLMTRLGWAERPQLWTYLFFALFLLLLEEHRQRPTRLVWFLVPLTILWANLHAGSILVFPLVLAYVAGVGIDMHRQRPPTLAGRDWRRLLLVFIALIPASLLTPYGLNTLRALLASPSLGVDSGELMQLYNMDWAPTTFVAMPWFFYALAVVVAVCLLNGRRTAASDLFLLGGLAFMGYKLVRHTPFFFFVAAGLLPLLIDNVYRQWVGPRSPVTRGIIVVAALSLLLYPYARLVLPEFKASGWFDRGLRVWHFPVAAADFVRSEKLPGNLWNTYDWGGYLMWTLYPDYHVFWDGRQDSKEMFTAGLAVMSGGTGWEMFLDRYQVRTIVTKACTVDSGEHYPLLDRLRGNPDWALVFADVSALIFVRRADVPSGWLQQQELPASRIDDTILSEAGLLVKAGPGRYMAWWEMARIHLARNDYRRAFPLLERHLATAPPGRQVAEAENYYRILYPLMHQ